jgi:hypothetical protein
VANIENFFIKLNLLITTASGWLQRLVRRLGVRGETKKHLILMKSRTEMVLDDTICPEAEPLKEGHRVLTRLRANTANRGIYRQPPQTLLQQRATNAPPLMVSRYDAPRQTSAVIVRQSIVTTGANDGTVKLRNEIWARQLRKKNSVGRLLMRREKERHVTGECGETRFVVIGLIFADQAHGG